MAVLNRHRIFVLVVIALGLLCAGIVRHQSTQNAKVTTPKQKMVYMLVTARALDVGAHISKETVVVKSVGMVDDLLLKMPNVIVLKTLDEWDIFTGQTFYRSKKKGALITYEDLIGEPTRSLRQGMRGYTFDPSTLKGWNHETRVDDRVNLYWVGTSPTFTSQPELKTAVNFLQNVRVVDVHRSKHEAKLDTITLSLSDEEIRAVLALPNGHLHMSLRNPDDRKLVDVAKTTSNHAISDIEILEVIRQKRDKPRHKKYVNFLFHHK